MDLKKNKNKFVFQEEEEEKGFSVEKKNDDEICTQEETDRFEMEGLIARLNAAENHWSVATPPEVKFEGNKKSVFYYDLVT